jgi:hypothetical protein
MLEILFFFVVSSFAGYDEYLCACVLASAQDLLCHETSAKPVFCRESPTRNSFKDGALARRLITTDYNLGKVHIPADSLRTEAVNDI